MIKEGYGKMRSPKGVLLTFLDKRVQFGESGSLSSILNISSSVWSNKEIFLLQGIFFSLRNGQNEK
jgi:hypothetical protein